MSDEGLTLPPPADPTAVREEPAAPSYADIRARKQRPRRVVPIFVDGAVVEFTFEAMPRPDFEELRGKHLPTQAQREEFLAAAKAQGYGPKEVGQLNHNPDTFPPVLIAACCVSPTLTLAEAETMWSGEDEFSSGELGSLFLAAYAVNNVNALAPLGNV